MGMKIRLTALILAASLTVNMVTLPVKAEEDTAPMEQQTLMPEASSADSPVSGAEQSASEPVVTQPAPSESTAPASEPADPTTPVTEPTEPATEPTEATTAETEPVVIPQPDTPEEALLLEPNEAAQSAGQATYAEGGRITPTGLIGTTVPLDGQTITIENASELAVLSHLNARIYQNSVLYFLNKDTAFDTTSKNVSSVFNGLGSEANPFSGTIQFEANSKTAIVIKVPLFNCLVDSAVISKDGPELSLQYAGTDSNQPALLATTVVKGAVAGSKEPWKITLQEDSDNTDVVSTPPLIGTIGLDCVVSLSLNDTTTNLPVVGSGSAGLLCGTLNGSLTLTDLTKAGPITVTANTGSAGSLIGEMGAGASLTVSGITGEGNSVTPTPLAVGNITATSGNAGGLVGSMEAGSELSINATLTLSGTISAASGSAGGLVGEATDVKLTNVPAVTGGTISGTHAGGLFGSYTFSGKENALNEVSQSISGITVNGSSNAGGVFGVLNNNSTGSVTINPVNAADGTAAVSVTFGSGSTGNIGGLIGQYQAGNLANAALILSAEKVTSSLTSSANAYGGLIGWVNSDGNPAYIAVQGKKDSETDVPATVIVQTGGTATNYGGLVAATSKAGHMISTGSVTVISTKTIKGTSAAGGLVGNMPSGVLRIDGTVTAAMPEGNQNNRGGILGYRDNTLVYATANGASGWPYYNSSNCNAIGNWGQVVRADKLSGLLKEETHTVKVSDLVATNTISSVTDFAAAALRFQLVSKDALQFENSYNAPDTLKVTQSVNLSETGITGFQQDYSGATKVNVTLTGGENISITFPDITVYPTGSSHNRQGLFANVGNLTVSSLELCGGTRKNDTEYGFTIQAQAGGTYAGAMAAEASGTVKLSNVKSHVKIDASGSLDNEKISGLIAFQSGGSLSFSKCEWDSDLSCGSSNKCFMGGFLARAEKSISNITVADCTISGSITKTDGNNYGGGLIGSLYDTNGASYGLEINKLEVDGVTIDASGCTNTGGLLGWEWMNTTATISDVTIKDCELNAGANPFGGLVYKGSGYWKVEKGTSAGIAFTGTNTISGTTSSGAPSGLLIGRGDKLDGHNNALYLEIHQDAYTIAENSVTLPEGFDYFDEIVGVTESTTGNGIVSYATATPQFDQGEDPDTYVNQLGPKMNGKTRYYYNLDSFGAGENPTATGAVNSPEKMVLLSAYDHCDSGLQKYFYSGTPGDITGDNLDLTGYSFYPLDSFHDIRDATIKFAYEDMNKLEASNKPFSESNKQHWGMHTGIFTGVTGQSDNWSVSNLTLQGTVGDKDGNYGALIRDGASGQNANNMLTLDIGPVTLDGIRVYPTVAGDDVKPLLINKLDSFTKLEIHNVSVTDSAYGDKTKKAASSLIGDVGNSTDGKDIQLIFSNMLLDGTVSGSIFSHATFLESFQYANSGCSGVYNFTKPTDNGNRNYTLGQELSNTEGGIVSGRNNGKQYWFYDTLQTNDDLVCGKDNPPGTFYASDDYLRYVFKPEGFEKTYHEIDINLKAEKVEGCGTYSDPYIIKDTDDVKGGDLLKNFAAAIENGGAISSTWTIRMNPEVLGHKFSDEVPKGDTHACVEYTCTDSKWSTTANVANQNPDNADVLTYLCNAYYKIDGKITTPEEWYGLGTANNPFSGVIVGEHGATVTISSTRSSQFGGLIKFSQGSVVKDLKVDYTGKPTVNTNNQTSNIPSDKSNASFFGGVVGWCIGGDTIIDSVEVTYQTGEPTVSGTNPHLTAVGGYVGMVGGGGPTVQYGGGVVFRGDSFPRPEIGTSEDSTSFYVNPFVGRVLDGYVMSEDATLNNTKKNYQIPTISEGKTLTRATIDGQDTVTVTDADDLWLLSAIVNSGAGCADSNDENNLAYTMGKARTGTYNHVGDAMPDDDRADEEYLGGKSNEKQDSYLTAKYTSGDAFSDRYFYNLCSSSGVFIVLEGNCDMTDFGNGFRGIGTSYGTNANNSSNYRLLPVSSVDGGNYTVTLAQDRKEYTEEKDTWTSIGSGLFVLLKTSGSFTASNLTFKGKTGISYYTSTKQSTDNDIKDSSSDKKIIGSLESGNRLSFVGVGMLAGNLANGGDISKFCLDKISVTGDDTSNLVYVNDGTVVGSTQAGGLIGALWNNGSISEVSLTDCGLDNISVKGRMNVGGFLGYVGAVATSINYTREKTLSNIQTTSTQNSPRNDDTYGTCGVGGLIGFNKSAMTINDTVSDGQISSPCLTLENLTVTNCYSNGTADRSHAGGLVGLWVQNKANTTATIKNITLAGSVEIIGGGSNPNTITGGLVGALVTGLWSGWEDKVGCGLEVRNIQIAVGPDSADNNSSMTISNSRQPGGLFGMTILKNDMTIDHVTIGADNCPVRITNSTYFAAQTVGALISTAVQANATISNVQIVDTTVLVRCNKDNGIGSRGSGLLIGYLEKGSTINLKNLLLKDSNFVTDNTSSNTDKLRSGLLYGAIKDEANEHKISGTNILVQDCILGQIVENGGNNDLLTFAPTKENVGLMLDELKPYSKITGTADEIDSYGNSKMGIFCGDSSTKDKKTVKLVGVSIQQDAPTLPMKDFGSNPKTYYVVRADYTGAAKGNASMVTKSPSGPLTIGEKTYTGDGASFVAGTTTPVGTRILTDANTDGKQNLEHTQADAMVRTGEDSQKAYEYLQTNSAKASFGTFKTEGGNTYDGADFPVLTLVTNSSIDANCLIYSWISLLTNRTINDAIVSASGSDVSITVTRWEWGSSGWAEDKTLERDLPLQFSDTKVFSLNKGVYDNGENRFTLLDVAFDDPTGGDDYHLYIPVIVQKMLRFHFWAAAQTGTTYIKSSYDEQSALAAASHGEKVTVLLTYEYLRSHEEWQDAVDIGDNLLFNFDKVIRLDMGLPDETRLTLVDCSNQNKAYTAEFRDAREVDNSFQALSFKKFKASDGMTPWEQVNLCEMLDLTANVDSDNGRYHVVTDAAQWKDATLRIPNVEKPASDSDYTYYRYYSADDAASIPTGSQAYSITVGWSDKDDQGNDKCLQEQYYLTIQTLADSDGVYNNLITCANSLGQEKKLPTLREDNPGGNEYARKGAENRVLIGDFFQQDVSIDTTATSDPVMSSDNNTINATLTSEIRFKDVNSADIFKRFASGQQLYQSFELRMQQILEGKTSGINLVPGTRITATYFLNDERKGTKTYSITRSVPSYRLDFPEGFSVDDWEADTRAEFKVELKLEYPDASILAQFPLINGDVGNQGVYLDAGSYLAYTEKSLPTTTVYAHKLGFQNFYRMDFNAASLNYYPVSSGVESVNQLGVNGWNLSNQLVRTRAYYDVSALDNAGNAEQIRCTLKLYQKNDSKSYDDADWEAHLADALTMNVHYNTSMTQAISGTPSQSRSEYTLTFGITDLDKDIPIEISVDMNVLTGGEFEDKALTYANYMVELWAELLDASGKPISGSNASDHIIYTNARINPNPVRPSENTP